MRSWTVAVLTACLLGLAGAAQAQTCGPLIRALSLDLSPGPGGGPRFTVPVTVNGKPKNFLLNTGNRISRITRRVITEMGIRAQTANSIRFLDLSGGVRDAFFVAADLGIGPVMAKQQEMLVDEGAGNLDGEFAPDLMQNYDIEMDFAGRKLNYFLTDHCPGKVVYWPNAGIASVDFRGWVRHGTTEDVMTIPVSIDGHNVIAAINSGSANSILDSDTARALFELTPDSPNTVPMGALDANPAHRVYGYVFKTLAIGGVTITNPRMVMRPDLLGKKSSDMVTADSHLTRLTDNHEPTMQIGMDVLRRLHIYVAAKEQKLYVTLGANQPQDGTPPPR